MAASGKQLKQTKRQKLFSRVPAGYAQGLKNLKFNSTRQVKLNIGSEVPTLPCSTMTVCLFENLKSILIRNKIAKGVAAL